MATIASNIQQVRERMAAACAAAQRPVQSVTLLSVSYPPGEAALVWEISAGGDFAENVTTRGIDLASLPIGARLHLGDALLEVTQIGKECHQHCAIYAAVGDCVMPRRGIFARVLRGGEIDRDSRCHYSL